MPTLLLRPDGETLRRNAARRFRGLEAQEPPRTTADDVEVQALVQALPSVGAPS